MSTKHEREFANSLGYLDGYGPEIKLHLLNMADTIDRLLLLVNANIYALKAYEENGCCTTVNKMISEAIAKATGELNENRS